MFKRSAAILFTITVLFLLYWIQKVVKGLMGVHKCCQRLSYLGRRDTISFMDDDPDIFPMRPASDSFGTARYYHRHHHIRHDPSSSEGFAEVGTSIFLEINSSELKFLKLEYICRQQN